MFGTLAGKALVPVGLAVTGFMVVCCLVLYTAIRDDLHRGEIVHATNLADTVLKSTRYAMLRSDRETLATMVNNVGEQQGVDHVRIFNKKGIITFSTRSDEINRQVDKNAEGCVSCHKGATPLSNLGTMEQARTFTNTRGNDVMAITAPIYNEPDCSGACHFHPAGQKVLGTLDIGLSRQEIKRSLSMLRIQMIIFTIMTLALTIGGVTALLRRNVFLPLHKLRQYVENSPGKNSKVQPPPHLPHDLDIIADNYYNLSLQAVESKDAEKASEPVQEQ